MAASALSKKISTLAQIAQDLRQGQYFNITRLTSLKSLCAEPEAANQFCFYLVQMTQKRMVEETKPSHLDEETWIHCQQIVDEASLDIENYLADPTPDKKNSLRQLFSRVQDVNNKYENQSWGPVRIIQSKEVLLVENALNCILRPSESSYWGYYIAREYAESYTPSYGSGLTPGSAPRVEEIANFWCQYHFGKPLDEWLNQPKRRSKPVSQGDW
jgi:hypothetical protein